LQDWLLAMPGRDEAIVTAHRHSQVSLSEMVRALGLSVSRVSRIVARAQESQTSDRTAGAAQ
jgi:DNA-directed RNA polymerase specialized sigma24 family protein